MNQTNLSSFIWSVADLLRGDYKQSDYGKVILPFTVLRRLDCVLEATKEAVLKEKEKRETAGLNPEPFLLKKSGQLFYNTSPLDMKKLMGDQDNIRENLFAYIQAFSLAVRDIFECFDFHTQVEYEIHDGDILMSRGNTLDLVGMAAFVQNVRSRLLLCDLVYRFRAKEDAFDPAFLVHSLRSKNVRSQIECNAVGSSATMKKVSQELVRNLFVCQPPLKEQQDISKQLATMSGAFDSLESEATHAIDLLQERRTALISAAVTGKIDVRDMSRGGAENAEKTK